MAKSEKTSDDLIRDRLNELQAELVALDEKNASAVSEMNALIDEENKLKEAMQAKAQEMAPYKERRAYLQTEIGKLARATPSGKSTSDAR